MKKIIAAFAAAVLLTGCKTSQTTSPEEEQPIITAIDLVNVKDDKVMVTIDPGVFNSEETVFYLPKTVPGTYSTSNYGKYAEEIKAFDYKGNELQVVQTTENSWRIPNAKSLDKISYWVNDTFDLSGEGGIYSMAGTNIKAGENFLLNLHGFVGYFQDMKEEPYRLEITRPSNFFGGSALTANEVLATATTDAKKDIYSLSRYFEVTDNPIMYSVPDTTSFDVQGMKVLLDVYSPNEKFTAEDLKPAMQKMITAQKNFLGEIDNTDKYAILLYLSATPGEKDAGNFGALEHHTSTVVVMPETMTQEALNKNMIDIVSHEFFHILTPLGVHSNEIHYFDYNDPKMSKHLWMYEGLTEYFANLFQVNQGLISAQDFYDRLNEKILAAANYDDTVPFTVMSENILQDEFGDSYANVYQKGALIGMALDIRLRELSDGRKGILDVMKMLTEKYGKEKPFNDDELIPQIVELTYPEIQNFFDTYVSGPTPLPYDKFFEKVGLTLKEGLVPVGYFLKDQATPYITLNRAGNIFVREDIELNSFMEEVGLEAGDMIKSINGTTYSAQNIYDLIIASQGWKEGDAVSITVLRDGKEILLDAKLVQPKAKGLRLIEMPGADSSQIELRHAWLKS